MKMSLLVQQIEERRNNIEYIEYIVMSLISNSLIKSVAFQLRSYSIALKSLVGGDPDKMHLENLQAGTRESLFTSHMR